MLAAPPKACHIRRIIRRIWQSSGSYAVSHTNLKQNGQTSLKIGEK